MTTEYAGSHRFRSNGSNIAPRCEFEDCGAGPGAPQHTADRFMIAAAHSQAIAEEQYRYGRIYGMGQR